MSHELWLLPVTAGAIGVVHTLLGPDHYLPFIAMARARHWSLRRTVGVTAVCGLGHVLGSIVLGVVGIAFGIGLLRLETIESARGDWAGWLMLAFGLAYMIWGLRRAVRGVPHEHWHAHADGTVHTHEHVHVGEHAHVHEAHDGPTSVTPWILFTIFVFGPCEPLIPVLMYPAAQASLFGVIVVAVTFALATIGTMLGVVLFALMGVRSVAAPLAKLERYSHAIAGLVIFLCGAAIKLGL